MLVNYHTHTARCHHASGSDREYVEAAIRAGLNVLGFSDHAPYLFADGPHERHSMHPDEAASYADSIRALAKEYASDIRLLVGYEIEYYPGCFDRTVRFLSEAGCDYLLLGQHFVGTEDIHVGITDDPKVFDAYIGQSLEAMETGMITYFCHPDICQYPYDLRAQEKGYVQLCETALRLGIPLEANMLGLWQGRHYPCSTFFRIASEVGNTIVAGCDSHSPSRVAVADEIKNVHAFAEAHNLILTELTPEQVLSRKHLIR